MGNLLQDAMSPSDAVERLGKLGVHVSERTLRKRARELGACRVLGKAMLLLPEHMVLIFKSMDPKLTVDAVRQWVQDDREERVLECAIAAGEPDSTVYFIERDGRVKIGQTRNLGQRLRDFRTASTSPINVLLTLQGGKALEFHFHQKFKDSRVEREWFEYRGDVEDFLARRKASVGHKEIA